MTNDNKNDVATESKQKHWIGEAIAALANSPNHLLALLIVVVFGGLTDAMVLIFARNPNFSDSQTMAFLGTAVVITALVLGLSYVAVLGSLKHQRQSLIGPIPDEGRPAPRSQNPIIAMRDAIAQELDVLSETLRMPLIKFDVLLELAVLDLLKDSADRFVARVRLKTSFHLANLSDRPETYCVRGSIDVRKGYDGAISADLRIRDLTRNRDHTVEVAFEQTSDARGMERWFKKDIDVEANSTVGVSWATKDYEVVLPYTEFWATSDAAVGLEVRVISSSHPVLVDADFYRREDSPAQFKRTVSDDGKEKTFTALGAFLPYQGMFVRVDSEKLSGG